MIGSDVVLFYDLLCYGTVALESYLKNLEIYNKVKMDIMTSDPKAVVRGNQYMGKPTKGIGHYLFIHYCGKDECNDILNKML